VERAGDDVLAGSAARLLGGQETLLDLEVEPGVVLGLRPFVEVDILVVPVQPGDRLLLCSDGLHAYLDSGTTLSDLFKLDVREAARAAIRHANACGGADNITALFVEFLALP